MAKLLERGGINALFLADTTGGHDTYEGKLDECIRRAAQWPVTDPTIVSVNNKMFRSESDFWLANFGNGCSDKESGVWHHGLDFI